MGLNETKLNKARLNENRIDLNKILLRMVPCWSNRNLVEISMLVKSEWNFRQNLSWGYGIDSEKLYKN